MGRPKPTTVVAAATVVVIATAAATGIVASRKPDLAPAITVSVDTLAGVTGLLAAVATAAAAYAAFRSASASNEVARNTREALARALRPTFSVMATAHAGSWKVSIGALSNGAREVSARIHTRRGQSIERSKAQMTFHDPDLQAFTIELGDALGDLGPPGPHRQWPSPMPHITLTFADDRDVARWEQTWASELAEDMGSGYIELYFTEGPPTLLDS